jgi:hypothetical protein
MGFFRQSGWGFLFWAKFGHLLTQKQRVGTLSKGVFFGKKGAKVAISQGKKKVQLAIF